MEDVSRENADEKPAKLLRFARGFSGIASSLAALAVLTAIIGWTVPADGVGTLRAGTFCAAALFFLHEALSLFLRKEPVLRHFAKHWFRGLLFFVVLALMVARAPLSALFERAFPDAVPHEIGIGYAAALSAAVLWAHALRVIRERRTFFRRLPLTPGRVFISSFVLLISAGTLLLKTPDASVSGISWCDALFLSTSAVCVTGLTPFDVARELTFSGQCILLALIQLGGLGVMSITYFFAHFFVGGLSLKNRFDFQDLFSEENIGQIGTVLAIIVGFTFTAEAIGAVAVYFSAADLLEASERPVFFAVFHAVSSFCNAGLSCLPGGMTDSRLCGNMGMIFSVFAMCFAGSLGFPVIKNFWMFFTDRLRTRLRRKSVGHVPVRLTTHTKIVLTTSLGVFAFGFAAFYLLDGTNWGADSVRRAFVLAGTSRTSGFDIAPTGDISPAAKLILMALMFIGGSPFSTAGGIKTTTFAVALLALRQYVLGRRDLEVFGRRLESDVARQVLAIISFAASLVFLVTLALCVLHPEIDIVSLAFEAVSAAGTVGLSCDVTPRLSDGAKYLVAGTMFVGRIGVLLFVTSFLPRRKTRLNARLPETSIVLS